MITILKNILRELQLQNDQPTNNIIGGLPINSFKDDFQNQSEQLSVLVALGKVKPVPCSFQGSSVADAWLLNKGIDMAAFQNQGILVTMKNHFPMYYGRLQFFGVKNDNNYIMVWDSVNNVWEYSQLGYEVQQVNCLFLDVRSAKQNAAPLDAFVSFQGLKIIP